MILESNELCGCHLRAGTGTQRASPLSLHSTKKHSHPSICRTGVSPSQRKRYPRVSTLLTATSLLPTSSTPSALTQALRLPPLSQCFSSTFPQTIPAHEGYTQIIANDRGHLLPSVPRSKVRHSPPFLPTGALGKVRSAAAWEAKSSLIHTGTRVPPSCQPAYPQGRVLAPGPCTMGDLCKTDAHGGDASAVGTLPNSLRTQK